LLEKEVYTMLLYESDNIFPFVIYPLYNVTIITYTYISRARNCVPR
jgi:hypothetical protein